MRRPNTGFTLIELLLVISIIVLLMALLAPAMNAAILAVKVRDTDQRIAMIVRAIEDYRRVYQSLPRDNSPDRTMDKKSNNAYPPYLYPDGTEATYLFNYGPYDSVYGGKFLAYFLMGPQAGGWHRPKNPGDTRDPYYRCKYITAEWDVPNGLTEYLANRPVSQGPDSDYPCPVFVDAFGLEGANGGTFGYQRADQRRSGEGRFVVRGGALWSAIYADMRSHPGYPGDNQYDAQLQRIVDQCPGDFMLISPGADRKFGWRVYGAMHNGEYLKGSWSDVANGIIDDQANFPLK